MATLYQLLNLTLLYSYVEELKCSKSQSIPNDVWMHLIGDGYLPNHDLIQLVAVDRLRHFIGNTTGILKKRKKEYYEKCMIRIIGELLRYNVCHSSLFPRELMNQFLAGFYGTLQYSLYLYYKNHTRCTTVRDEEKLVAYKVMELKRLMMLFKKEFGEPKPMHELLLNSSLSKDDVAKFEAFVSITKQCNEFISIIESKILMKIDEVPDYYRMFVRMISDLQMIMQSIGLTIGYPGISGFSPPRSIMKRYMLTIIDVFNEQQQIQSPTLEHRIISEHLRADLKGYCDLFLLFYVLKKLRDRQKYAQKIFKNPSELNNRAVLITGCDTGFGNQTAKTLHAMGFCVIATVLKQTSADDFNESFNGKNGSISFVMDITKLDKIIEVKQKVDQHLKEKGKVLWGLVNNAGLAPPGAFEMLTPKYLDFYCNVLLIGHFNVTREFLPLLEGRKNLNRSNVEKANGGRIINISSCSIYTPSSVWMLYGSLKSALAYWSHGLRYEISPRFGISVSSVEPGGFSTNIWDIQERLIGLKKETDASVWNAYEFDEMLDFVDEGIKNVKDKLQSDLTEVVDDIVHGLTSKYPMQSYKPGWDWKVKLINSVSRDSANYLLNMSRIKAREMRRK